MSLANHLETVNVDEALRLGACANCSANRFGSIFFFSTFQSSTKVYFFASASHDRLH